MGALADGYNGEGDGLASAAFEDATTFIPLGAVAGAMAKSYRILSKSSKISAGVANKINHIFGKVEHNLGDLVKTFGGETKAFKALEKATMKAVDASKEGKFRIDVKVGGKEVTVKGNVVDGEVKIGTAFAKDPNWRTNRAAEIGTRIVKDPNK